VVIAHYSSLKALGAAAFGYLMPAYLGYALTQPADPMNPYSSRPVLIIGLTAGLVLAAMVTAMLARIVLNRGRAIWTEGDRIYYVNRWLNWTTLRADIISVAPGFYVKQLVIVLALRNGRTKKLPVSLLREPPDEILEHVSVWFSRSSS
jgi:hypothetical protein